MDNIEQTHRIDLTKEIGNGVALVDFNAPWCGPCRAMESVIDKLAKAYHGKAAVIKVNIDENRKIAREQGVHSIPTLVVYKEGREINRFIGLQNAGTLNRALENALELKMD